MSVIHPNTLFHFTQKETNLKLIIRNGLRFSYCFEDFSNNVGMAIPMICFCDIPLLRTMEHRHKYGHYMIGVDKLFLRRHLKHVLNPVAYHDALFLKNLSPESFYSELEIINNAYSNFIQKRILPLKEENENIVLEEILKEDEELNYKSDCAFFAKNSLLYNLAFSKLYSYIEMKNGKRIEHNNYDEREWRYVPFYNDYEEEYKLKWITKIDKDNYIRMRKILQENLHNNKEAYLTLNSVDICQAINYIVVKYKRQIPAYIHLIMSAKTLFGATNITKEQRQLLITKITSFEDIEKNF